MTFVETLEPQALWQHFDQILTIPHGSGNEAALREHIIEIAKRNGLEYQVDGVGNLLVRKPGSAGKENAPAVVLQNHLDMVNEKNSDGFDAAGCCVDILFEIAENRRRVSRNKRDNPVLQNNGFGRTDRCFTRWARF